MFPRAPARLRIAPPRTQAKERALNPTIEKFGYPRSLVRELGHWLLLVRPAQVTLGSLVLAAKSEATAFSQLAPEAFAGLGEAVAITEQMLGAFRPFERINYLMLMMVDRNVHFHVVPRYSQGQRWDGVEFLDTAWPGPPQLSAATTLSPAQITKLARQLATLIS